MSADKQLKKIKDDFSQRFFELLPEVASTMGLHDPYDFQLSKGDMTNNFKIEKMLEESTRQMKETIDYNALNDWNKIDWHVFENFLEFWKFKLHEERQEERNPDGFGGIGQAFFLMATRDYAPLEKRVEAMIARIKQIPRFLKEFRTIFEGKQPVKLWTEMALETAQTMPGLFQFIASFGKGQIPDNLQNQLETVVTNLEDPIKEHITWLQELLKSTTEEWRLGPELFERLIQLQGFGITSDEILEFGTQSLRELKKARTGIAAQIDPDKSVEEVLALIEKDSPATFDEMLQKTRDTMEEAKQFVIDNDLASVYEEDQLKVIETPSFMTTLIPVAGLLMPAIFDEVLIGEYVTTRPKNEKNLGKIWNYSYLRNTGVHEGYPGHFLHGSNISKSLKAGMSSLIQLFSWMLTSRGSEVAEGWAHYCEEMMYEQGFLSGPKEKMAQITGAILRAVRIIVDIRLSRKEMTFDEAVEMIMKETGFPKETAVGEVRWYSLSPSYPLSYLLGKHLILKLREEIKQKMGDQYSDKFFHDTVMTGGIIPVSLLRQVFNQK
ncbi:MAG: DUF885 domain-containing protein, partial [Candidatus Hermodarchaeota archaeon]